MNQAQQRSRGMMLAVTAAVLWGISGTSVQFLIERRGVGIGWLVAVRMLTAGVLMLLMARARGEALRPVWQNRSDCGQLLVFSLFGMLAVQYTYFAAIRHSNAATATVLQFTGPVLIALWLCLRGRRWPGGRESLTVALAVTGILLLVTHGRFTTLAISGAALFWGLGSAVALALYSLQPAALLKKYPASVLTGWAMLTGGTVLSVLHAPWKPGGLWDLPASLHLLFIIVLGTLVPFQFYMVAVRLTGGQTTSLLLSAEPLAATVTAVVWLGVPFGLMDWIGTACILGTVFLLARAPNPR